MRLILTVAALWLGGAAAHAELPEALLDVSFDQRLGATLPLDTPFVDEAGNTVQLGDYFGERPVILSFVYFDCPMLCTQVLNGLVTTLKAVPFEPGEAFELVTISFDPREGADVARAAKAGYVERYGKENAAHAWHFLTGTEEAIQRVTGTAGFRAVYAPASDEYAHASGIIIATPAGQLARYYYGIEYAPRDVKLGLMDASEERIGNLVDQVLLYCFAYNPATGTYSAVIMRVLRLGAVATVCALALTIGTLLWRDRRRRPATEVAS